MRERIMGMVYIGNITRVCLNQRVPLERWSGGADGMKETPKNT